MLKNQSKGHWAFVSKDDFLIKKELKSNRFDCKIIKVNTKKINNYDEKIKSMQGNLLLF